MLILAQHPAQFQYNFDNLYIETHYDIETLLRILMVRILYVAGYDYSHISVDICISYVDTPEVACLPQSVTVDTWRGVAIEYITRKAG